MTACCLRSGLLSEKSLWSPSIEQPAQCETLMAGVRCRLQGFRQQRQPSFNCPVIMVSVSLKLKVQCSRHIAGVCSGSLVVVARLARYAFRYSCKTCHQQALHDKTLASLADLLRSQLLLCACSLSAVFLYDENAALQTICGKAVCM